MSSKADIQRLVGDLIRPGRIASVDLAAKRCTVEVGDLTTGPLPWIAFRAGRARSWSPPTEGEQCLLLCSEGDTNAGFVIPGLFSDAFAAPSSSPDEVAMHYDDGSVVTYDMASHTLTVDIASGKVIVNAPNGLTVNGPVTINGTLTATDDVIGGGKSLKGHKHRDTQPGSGQSGVPV